MYTGMYIKQKKKNVYIYIYIYMCRYKKKKNIYIYIYVYIYIYIYVGTCMFVNNVLSQKHVGNALAQSSTTHACVSLWSATRARIACSLH